MSIRDSQIPSPLLDLFKYLDRELMRLYVLWADYQDLYLRDEQRVEVLNRTAQSFFGQCQYLLRNDIFLSLARMTDPLESAGKENLTLYRIEHLLPAEFPTDIREDIKGKIKAIVEDTRPIRDWRNRRLAHNDLALTLDYSANPLPGVTRETVDHILFMVGECLNPIRRHFDKSTTWYSVTQRQGGADRLVHHLQNALKWQEDDIKRKLGGTT